MREPRLRNRDYTLGLLGTMLAVGGVTGLVELFTDFRFTWWWILLIGSLSFEAYDTLYLRNERKRAQRPTHDDI
jgi:hypothetical protein